MQKCPSCNFRNLDSRDTCLKCTSPLRHDPELSKPIESRFARLTLRLPTARPLSRLGRRIARAFAVPLPTDLPHRNPYVAALLGFFPGLGQIYNHQWKKTLYFIFFFALFAALSDFFILTPYLGNVLIFAAFAVPMVSFTDAFLSAARINGQEFNLRYKLAALTWPFFLVGVFGMFCSLLSFFGWPVLSRHRVMYDYMAPALRKGEGICGEAVTYIFREPQPGDVVRYDPPGYSVETPGSLVVDGLAVSSDRFLVDPNNGWERIMAVGGETLEFRDGRYYVNGRLLSTEYHPLLSGRVYPKFTLTCPPGKFIILISSNVVDNSIVNHLKGKTSSPDFLQAGVIVIGWDKACLVDRDAILNRAWFRYLPGPRRRLFQAKGPRFLQERGLEVGE